MNILISNDDGIFARGLHLLTQAFAPYEDVNLYVCAPDKERSCVGHGLTLFNELVLEDWPLSDFQGPVVWAKSCSGTPGDCIRIALCILEEEENVHVDLVCSGINDGSNVGSDINYSGTIAACREAVIDGIPAIGFSSSRGLSYGENFLRIVPYIIDHFAGKIPENTILNVNTIDIPWSELKGYRSAKLAHLHYPCLYKKVDSDDGKRHYGFASFSVINHTKDEDADRNLVNDGYIAVSFIPLLQDAEYHMAEVDALL